MKKFLGIALAMLVFSSLAYAQEPPPQLTLEFFMERGFEQKTAQLIMDKINPRDQEIRKFKEKIETLMRDREILMEKEKPDVGAIERNIRDVKNLEASIEIAIIKTDINLRPLLKELFEQYLQAMEEFRMIQREWDMEFGPEKGKEF